MNPLTATLPLLALMALLAAALPAGAGPPVAAAASLRVTLEALHAGYRDLTGDELQITYGSSGNFVRQIERGAPFELFLSADEASVERLVGKGLARDEGVVYGIGRIVVFAPEGSPLRPDPRLDHLRELLGQPGNWRFAIANPEHAPYGRAAVEALTAVRLWTAIEPRLVLGENVAQAAQFATRGNSIGGIVAWSLVVGPELERRGRYALVDAELHEPIRQRMVLLAGASPATIRFYAYLQEPAARAVFERYGFETPRGCGTADC